MRRFLLPALFLFGSVLAATGPASAASGGSTLPFNDALTTIQDNLTGPTANTVIIVVIIAALITIAISKEAPMMKHMGQAVIVCALIAKAASLPSILGLGTATSVPYAWLPPAAGVAAVYALLASGLLFALPALGERKSRQSPRRLDSFQES
jgi:type IV secretory pathway VirB2 component (pilin)